MLLIIRRNVEKLTERKEVDQAADHDGRQPRQHNVRIRNHTVITAPITVRVSAQDGDQIA